MATVHFTGASYSGHDGATPIRFAAPGHYQVSEAKAQQLTHDFPREFTQVHEGKESKAAKAPSADESHEQAPASKQETKPAKKGS